MSFFRNVVIAGALALTGTAHAADVSMAGGSVTFSTPDQWIGIMERRATRKRACSRYPTPRRTATAASPASASR